MNRVWRSSLPSHLRIVAIAIADSANDDGVCWPGQMKLADKCGIGDRALRKSLAALEEQGYLSIEQRGKQRTNVYELHVDRDGNPTRVTGTTVPPTLESDWNHSSTSDRNHSSGPNRNPQLEPSEQPLTTFGVAIAPESADPPWVQTATVFPIGQHDATDNGERCDWQPQAVAHKWKHPTHGTRDLLWEATLRTFGIDQPNDRERGKLNKALKEYRQSGVDPSELPTLRRVYQMKMSHAADTPLGLAGHIANCRRWANEVTTVDPKALQRSAKKELQRQAMEKLRLVGPVEEDPDSPIAVARRRARGQA